MKRFGLAFSGGGVRGLAHIGFLSALEAAGHRPSFLAGSSMGGLVAAAYACGAPIPEMKARALKLAHMHELVRLVDLSPQRRGLLLGEKVRDYVMDFFLERCFEDLSIPLALTAVDATSRREVVFRSGLVFPVVMATIAIPGLFNPVSYGPYRLIDGGVLNNLPVDVARSLGAEIVIAVDVSNDPRSEPPLNPSPGKGLPLPGFVQEFYRALMIQSAELTRLKLERCPADLLIRPPIAADVDMFLGFRRIPEVIAAGEAAGRTALEWLST